MKNIWQKLPKPFFVLAPMDDVTDIVFRQIVNETARPDLFFTEFTNVEGLQSAGREKLLPRLFLNEKEKPIIAQIWGQNPQNYYKTAKDLVEMGFDGIDINMGCPEKKVVKNGCCSALINNPTHAKEIIQATIEGASSAIPVSVKTRIGFKTIQTEEWIGFLLQQPIQALTIHGRTAKEMSKVPAHWDQIGVAVSLRNQMKKEIVIIGNGDVVNKKEGLEKATEFGVDGVMIGRGIFKDIFAFSDRLNQSQKSEEEMLSLLLHHTQLFDKTWGKKKNFAILRKFFKIYLTGFPNAAKLRELLFQTNNREEVETIVRNYLNVQRDSNDSSMPSVLV